MALIDGTTGDDSLIGTAGDDTINGLAGNDTLGGRAGNDVLNGGAGDDLLSDFIADGGTIDGGAGVDTVRVLDSVTFIGFTNGPDPNSEFNVSAVFGGDQLFITNVEFIEYNGLLEELVLGTPASEVLTTTTALRSLIGAGAGDDTIMGGAGQDSIYTGTGNDVIDGGADFDHVTFQFNNESSGITVTDTTVTGLGTGEVKSFTNVESILMSVSPGSISVSGDFVLDASALTLFEFSFATGNGDDTLMGGALNDFLNGNSGGDSVSGGGGNDTLRGGSGSDTLDGGSGFDTAEYFNTSAGVDVSLLSGQGNAGVALGDVLSNIEALAGSIFDDTLTGSDTGNVLDGADGNDLLTGERGNDTLIGGGGDDTLNGGKGKDHLDGGVGADTASYADATGGVQVELWSGLGKIGEAKGDVLSSIEALVGSDFNDKLTGSGAGDLLDGGAGHDRLWGSGGGDVAQGGAGNDEAFGQRGNDTLMGDAGNDTLNGGKGKDQMDGGAGIDAASYDRASGGVQVELWSGLGKIGEAKGDILSNIEGLIGSNFNDKLVGDGSANMLDGGSGHDRLWASGGNDTLEGGNGNDLLKGQAGDDVMNGGAGLDTLDGAAGDDTFQFGPGGGADLFKSFTAGAATDDKIELLGFGAVFDTFAEVIAAATQSGADTVIDFGGGDVITLENTTLAALHADDFLFS